MYRRQLLGLGGGMSMGFLAGCVTGVDWPSDDESADSHCSDVEQVDDLTCAEGDSVEVQGEDAQGLCGHVASDHLHSYLESELASMSGIGVTFAADDRYTSIDHGLVVRVPVRGYLPDNAPEFDAVVEQAPSSIKVSNEVSCMTDSTWPVFVEEGEDVVPPPPG